MWTPKEIALLKKEYPKRGIIGMQALLQKPYSTIHNTVVKCKLHMTPPALKKLRKNRAPRRVWSAEDIANLVTFYPIEGASHRLQALVNRTSHAIHRKVDSMRKSGVNIYAPKG